MFLIPADTSPNSCTGTLDIKAIVLMIISPFIIITTENLSIACSNLFTRICLLNEYRCIINGHVDPRLKSLDTWCFFFFTDMNIDAEMDVMLCHSYAIL